MIWLKRQLGCRYRSMRILFEYLRLHIVKHFKARELKCVQNHLEKINTGDILLFATMKNETVRLPYFLAYYRQLGVNHFVFVDNGSDDGMAEALNAHEDVTIFYTEGSYKAAAFGMHWLNWLLRRIGTGHWCLVCDPDEFLVYPYMEHRTLPELTQYLESVDQSSLCTLLVDMYADRPLEKVVYSQGGDPLKLCPYYDGYGYRVEYGERYKNQFIQGGVRMRVFNQNTPEAAPALNKVPLVKWQRHYVYASSTHVAFPRQLNTKYAAQHTTGALLHFKFLHTLMEKIEEEMQAQQHWGDSAEYKQYHATLKAQTDLHDASVSIRYASWHTLEASGLLNRGEWL